MRAALLAWSSNGGITFGVPALAFMFKSLEGKSLGLDTFHGREYRC
jgi:hypothetical protein